MSISFPFRVQGFSVQSFVHERIDFGCLGANVISVNLTCKIKDKDAMDTNLAEKNNPER